MQKLMFNNKNIFFKESNNALEQVLSNYNNSKLFVLTDSKVFKNCFSKIKKALEAKQVELIVISDGESYKSINSCNLIWQTLINHNADRNTILINLGGGVILDLGGFAASVYKRGINFINIPTTLLSQADVSLGSKTGVNFLNIKNTIGTFSNPISTIIDTSFLDTLNNYEFLSGFAEIIKHSLVADHDLFEQLISCSSKESLLKIPNNKLNDLLLKSLTIKYNIINKDLYEQNERKKLNFGHNIAHAIESLYLIKGKNILHGYAVAFGIIAESYLSYKTSLLGITNLYKIVKYILSNFSDRLCIERDDFELLYSFMLNDKKNIYSDGNNALNFTLLKDIGSASVDNYIHNKDVIKEAIDFTINENLLFRGEN